MQNASAVTEASRLKITKTIPNLHQNSHKQCNEKSMKTETTLWSEFPNGGKAIVEEILGSEEINKSKRAGLWESSQGFK